jgi:ABC-type sugar transport system ATPase subunit
MIAGLETITSGEIAIGGKVVNEVEPKDRNIAMVFQNYALYPHMTVYENMSYGLRIRRLPREEINARVQRAAKILELAPFLQRRPRELSGGQRQRVAMGRASRPRSSSTSRFRTWMRSCACRCASRSRSCTASFAPRASSSRTTRSKP